MVLRLTARKLFIAVLAALLAATAVSITRGGGAAPSHPLPTLPARLAAVNPSAIYLGVAGYTGGESTSAKHPHLSTAFSVSSGLINAGSRTSPSRVSPSSVVIVKPIDAYTTQFAKSASTGHLLTTVTLYLDNSTQSGEIDQARYILSSVFVKSDALHSSTTSVGSESVTLQIGKLQFTYYSYNADGVLSSTFNYCWNFVTNAAC
jgi:type VI protein secretion system component Hcp